MEKNLIKRQYCTTIIIIVTIFVKYKALIVIYGLHIHITHDIMYVRLMTIIPVVILF